MVLCFLKKDYFFGPFNLYIQLQCRETGQVSGGFFRTRATAVRSQPLWYTFNQVSHLCSRQWCHIFCDTFIWDCTILPAMICLGTLSGMVQLVCEWVISCPWMKSSVVNERHSLNSPSHRWRNETKRNGTITRLRGNKCLSLGSNSFSVQHTELLAHYLLPTGWHTGSLTVKLFYK